eukprot:11193874-Lingulodinium_polyedra.AAC.1
MDFPWPVRGLPHRTVHGQHADSPWVVHGPRFCLALSSWAIHSSRVPEIAIANTGACLDAPGISKGRHGRTA